MSLLSSRYFCSVICLASDTLAESSLLVVVLEQDEILDQSNDRILLCGRALSNQQCDCHKRVVLDQLLYGSGKQCLVAP